MMSYSALRTRSWLALACVCGVLPWSFAAPRVIESVDAPAREHHLFAGVELFWRKDGELLPVQGFKGKEAIVRTVDGTHIPMDSDQGFTWKMKAKVSSVEATVVDLNTERVFSLARDPVRQGFSTQTAVADYFSDQSDMANNAIRAESQGDVAVSGGGGSDIGSINRTSGGDEGIETSTTIDASNEAAIFGETFDSEFFEAQSERQAQQEGFDALLIKFRVSSKTPLANAYAVFFIRLLVDEALVDLNFSRRIGQVMADSRSIVVERVGLPIGYEIVDTRIYLFNHGREVATNFSERRIDLTSEEAREFSRLDHLTQHRTAAAPAQPVWSMAPRMLHSASSSALFDVAVTLVIDEFGAVESIGDDDQVIPAQVKAAIESMTFVPEIDNGTPRASRIKINLADYFN